MRVGALLLVVLIASASLGRAQHRSPVADFVRAIPLHGLTYADAALYTSRDSGVLIGMLRDVDDAEYWPTAAMVLGIIGDDCAVQPLIDFVEGRGSDLEWSDVVHRARMSGITGLGYLARKRGNEQAMAYLLASVDPDTWLDREIPWLTADGDDEAARLSLQLAGRAVLALGLTGRESAGQRLDALATGTGVDPAFRQLAVAAKADWEQVPGSSPTGFPDTWSTPARSFPLTRGFVPCGS